MIFECIIVMFGLCWAVQYVTDEVIEQRRRETKTGEYEE